MDIDTKQMRILGGKMAAYDRKIALGAKKIAKHDLE